MQEKMYPVTLFETKKSEGCIMPYVILGTVITLLGLFMIICPKLSVKKEFRDDAKAVSGMRIRGIVVLVCGVLVFVINTIM